MQVYLGTKERDGRTVSIEGETRRKHMAIFGKSGVGKTTLMRNMIVADLDAGNGLTVVDPHGALVEDLLDAIPRHRTNDVIYINPADPARVIGLNVLQSVDRNQRSLVVSSLISILNGICIQITGGHARNIFWSTQSMPCSNRKNRSLWPPYRSSSSITATENRS
jgi:GTPase SAR1 family protein